MSKKRGTDSGAPERTDRPRTRSRFGRWYRGRPFVGGLLIMLAGIEMILSSQLDLGNIHIQVGIEGMQAMILPIALITLGALVLAMPVHRIFYGVMSLAFSIYALVGVNLGGFFVGTLVGIVGGVVSVSWMSRRTPAAFPAASENDGLDLGPGPEPALGIRGSALVIAVVAALVGASLTGLTDSPSFALSSAPTQGTTATDPDAPTAAVPSARLRGASVSLDGAQSLGTVTVALADGSSVTALKISADRVEVGGYTLASADPAARTATSSGSVLTLSGPVTLYCTSLAGTLADGTAATFDPSAPPPPGAALPSLTGATVGLVAVTSAAATLAGAVVSVR